MSQTECGLALDRLYPGDCLEQFRVVADSSIDLVFADPPFNIGYDYDVYDDRRDTDQYLDWAARWGREIVRVLFATIAPPCLWTISTV